MARAAENAAERADGAGWVGSIAQKYSELFKQMASLEILMALAALWLMVILQPGPEE
jgi:hypothetical protein